MYHPGWRHEGRTPTPYLGAGTPEFTRRLSSLRIGRDSSPLLTPDLCPILRPRPSVTISLLRGHPWPLTRPSHQGLFPGP